MHLGVIILALRSLASSDNVVYDWGEPKRAPHLSLIQENRYTYVCVYVAICRPRAHHAIAHVQAS